MENIKIATVCGLCQGCKTAINLAIKTIETENTTILKEIVHNKNVNDMLKSKGITCADNLETIDKFSTIVIRAHGEPPETYEFLNEHNIKFVDGTCKNVKSIHNEIQKYSELGYEIILVGKYGKYSKIIHPEILGSIGYSKNTPILIEDIDDVKKLEVISNSKLLLICQTTFNPVTFETIKNNIASICNKNNNTLVIKNTICGAQMAILKSSLNLATQSDVMIVVGGKHSSNTIELFKNVSHICPAIHIENINEWKNEFDILDIKINKDTKIGITAGASTEKSELSNLKTLIKNHFNSL